MEKVQTIPRNKNNHHWKIYLVLVFLGIFAFIIYTSFYNSELSLITGNVIKSTPQSVSINEKVDINAKLELPNKLDINSNIEKISLKTSKDEKLQFGNQIIELTKKSSIVIDNYQGKLNINSKNLSLEGRASKIFVNGIPIKQSSGSATKISFENSIKYEFLELTNFNINNLQYQTSGNININKDKIILNIENEEIDLTGFEGDLTINNNQLKLKGSIKNFDLNKLLKNSKEEIIVEESEN